MANRRTFVTGNQLGKTRYFAILGAFIALLVLFCALGNVGVITAFLSQSSTQSAEQEAKEILSVDAKTQQQEIDSLNEELASSSNANILISGEGEIWELFSAQLFMSKHAYVSIDSLKEASKRGTFKTILLCKEYLSDWDIAWLSKQVDDGATLLFGKLPENSADNEALAALVGASRIDPEQTFSGTRMSSELLDGTMVEDPKKHVTAWDVSLKSQTKVYADALPKGYEDMENEDLPPLVWRYIKGNGSGHVYVCNGDFMESETAYSLIPLVMRESQGSYLYPIVNAYCTFIKGAPYANNEERQEWTELYSRDKLGIQQDMLMPEFERFAQVYGSKLTYFSEDSEAFKNSSDQDLSYYAREIDSQGGQLALDSNGKLCLFTAQDPILITDWTAPYKLWDEATQSYELPINCSVTKDNYDQLPDLFCLASITGSIGYYGVCVDVDDFLDFSTDENYWADYTKEIEVLFGTHQRDYSWIERTTANEALARVNRLLNLQADIQYNSDDITVDIQNFDGQAWFILRTSHENLEAQGADIQEIGDGMFLISATSAQVTINWSDGL